VQQSWRKLSLYFCFFATGAASIRAQSINSGTLTGTVSDPSGSTIPGAMVKLENSVTGYSRSATADSTGSFRFINIPLNNYKLSVTAAGFASATL
jgi:hypothetical protein